MTTVESKATSTASALDTLEETVTDGLIDRAITSPERLESGRDLNNYYRVGFYNVAPSVAHVPYTNTGGYLIITDILGHTDTTLQEFISHDGKLRATRTGQYESPWKAWSGSSVFISSSTPSGLNGDVWYQV